MRTKLEPGQRLISATEAALPNGDTMVLEIVAHDESTFVVSQSLIPSGSSEAKETQHCGYCQGVLVGCVTCNNYTLDCVRRRIYCN